MTEQNKERPEFISRQVIDGRYCFIDLSVQNTSEISINCVGRENCAPEYFLDRKEFKYHAVEFITSGNWIITTHSSSQNLTSGNIFSYSPDTPFTMQAVGPGPWIKYFFDFSGDASSPWLGQVKLPPLNIQWVSHLNRFINLMNQLLDLDEYPREQQVEAAKHYLALLSIHLKENVQPPTHAHKNTGQDTYQRCRDYIGQHYKELKSIKEWSDACHISQAYLSRLFGKHASESPLQLMTRLKMDHAAQRIRFDGVQIKYAAQEVGFDDPYHFSRVFKNTYGLPPSHIRE